MEPVLLLHRSYVSLYLNTKIPYPRQEEANCSIQAGLAAYFLGHPDYQERFKYSEHDYANNNTVGKRMKDFLKELAYQRVPKDQLWHPGHLDDCHFPNNAVEPTLVEVAYNGFHGDQKKAT
jgi:hypothetical protein